MLVAISNDVWAVKLCSNRILQFLTESTSYHLFIKCCGMVVYVYCINVLHDQTWTCFYVSVTHSVGCQKHCIFDFLHPYKGGLVAE